jgi:hypothetical protein
MSIFRSVIAKCRKCEHHHRNNCIYDGEYFIGFDKQGKRCKGFEKQRKKLVKE